MPIINVYLDEELYKLVKKESKKFKNIRGESSPSILIQNLIKNEYK